MGPANGQVSGRNEPVKMQGGRARQAFAVAGRCPVSGVRRTYGVYTERWGWQPHAWCENGLPTFASIVGKRSRSI